MRTRRNLLRAGAAVFVSGVASPAISKIATADVRSLALANLHTGEKLAVDYWVEGQYVAGASFQPRRRARKTLSQLRPNKARMMPP